MSARAIFIYSTLQKLYKQGGNASYSIGEPLSILEHSIETAKLQLHTHNSRLIVVSLLHDIGHLTRNKKRRDMPLDPRDGVDDRHEYEGANILAELGFKEDICAPIRMHVNAKRYLCLKSQSYKNSLSVGSFASLELQGGMMNKSEAREFENEPYFANAIELRKNDDLAKAITGPQMPFDYFKIHIMNVLDN